MIRDSGSKAVSANVFPAFAKVIASEQRPLALEHGEPLRGGALANSSAKVTALYQMSPPVQRVDDVCGKGKHRLQSEPFAGQRPASAHLHRRVGLPRVLKQSVTTPVPSLRSPFATGLETLQTFGESRTPGET